VIQFPIRNRYTGNVQFTAAIAADESAPRAVKVGLAVRWAVQNKANLARADLAGAELTGADLAGAELTGADLDGANLAGADLTGADLDGADLTRANLDGANLAGADLTRANLAGASLTKADLDGANLTGAIVCGDEVSRVVAIASRINDPYQFTAFELKAGGVKVLAGCRWLSIEAYRAHVADEYPDTEKGRETLDILAFIEARVNAMEASQ
jgi:hypothetical protein